MAHITKSLPHVVIVGAGFGGLKAATKLKDAPVRITLIERHNYHTFQPLLYQVATAALEPEQIAHTVRGTLHEQENIEFRLGTVEGADWPARVLVMEDGDRIPFDFLILAAGANTNYFGIEGVEENSFPLKTVAEAVNLRSHVIAQFERADAARQVGEPLPSLNFVVVGGGPTGVEMAGAFRELFTMVLEKDFPQLHEVIEPQVYLIEAADYLLAPFHPASRDHAAQVLRDRGVQLLLGDSVVRATPSAVYLKSGREIPTETLIWAAGIRAAPLADRLGLPQERGGRITVNPDLSVPDHEGVYIIGDMAASKDAKGNLYPQVAQVALQGASYVTKRIKHTVGGRRVTPRPFRYFDPGMMATIGRNEAVTELPGGLRFRGWLAWLAWLFLHLMYLVGFRNRLAVFFNWAWNYFTYDRSARLIFDRLLETGD